MQELLFSLEAMRNETTFAHNAKYGATMQYGVKLGDLRKIAKGIKNDNHLAIELWNTGIAEAQLVATLIAKPKDFGKEDLDKMVRTIHFSQVADWFQSYVLKDRADKIALYTQWIKDENKWALRAAWSLLAGFLAQKEHDFDIQHILGELANKLFEAAPEVQWTMNNALAQIGIHYPKFTKQAIEIGERLGIYRDYPVSKGCTSPFAPIWIEEMIKRNANKP